jgi:endo-1,4-beta-xylanase
MITKGITLTMITTAITMVSFAQEPASENENTETERKDRPRRVIEWVNPDIPDMPGLKHHVLESEALGHEVGYTVWTPPEYSKQKKKRYPVIYFLHGAGGNETADAAGFTGWAVKAMEKGSLPYCICVYPNGGMSGYRNEVEKMIIGELIPTIDKTYLTIAKPSSRALAGFSMGGAGSVYLSMRHPDLFCAAGSMGGAFFGRSRNPEYAALIDQSIEKALPVWKRNGYGFFLVNGENDRPDAFTDFAARLDQEGIDNEIVILPDTPHNLGLYYERSVEQLLVYLGKFIQK